MSDAGEDRRVPTGDEQPSPVTEAAAEDVTEEAVPSEEGPGAAAREAERTGDELSQATAERDEYLDSLRRLQADFDNYRKRAVRQQTELLERASESLLVELLPVLDALELAEAHAQSDDAALAQIGLLLRGTLERAGLERIGSVGEAFDPNVHDAVAHEAADAGEDKADGEASSGSGPEVAEVLRSGYRLKGRVLRPAMVKVKG